MVISRLYSQLVCKSKIVLMKSCSFLTKGVTARWVIAGGTWDHSRKIIHSAGKAIKTESSESKTLI